MAVGEEVEGFSNDELEREMCGLQARLAAATCRFLVAVGEYDRRRAWEAWECHDMAGWLAWKCGISPVTAREQVRVARALEGLPVVRRELGEGRLSYSQARAISRVTTASTEASLVDLAKVCTAAQLERICRAYRRCGRVATAQEQRRDAGRYVRLGWDEEGNLVGRFRLPAEAGAVLVHALDALNDRDAVAEAEADGAADPVGAVRADSLVELVGAGATAIENQAGGGEGDDSCYLLTVIADEASLHPDSDQDGSDQDAGQADDGHQDDRPPKAVTVDAGGVCQVADGPGIAGETARRVACDATVVRIVERTDGSVLDVGRRTRRITRPLRRALKHRDGHCQFPGCDRARTQAHHIVHWIDGGATRLDNLVSLCARHHHRLHEGGFRIQNSSGGDGFVFLHRYGHVLSDAKPQIAAGPPLDYDDRYSNLTPFHCDWDGTRADLPAITEGLALTENLALAEPAAATGGRQNHDSAESAPDPARPGDRGPGSVVAKRAGADLIPVTPIATSPATPTTGPVGMCRPISDRSLTGVSRKSW